MAILNSGDIVVDGQGNVRVIYRANYFNPDWYETAPDPRDLLHTSRVSSVLGNIQTLVSTLLNSSQTIRNLQSQVSSLQTSVSALQSPANQFQYNQPANAPVITSVVPSSGSNAGGYQVTINGSGFTGVSSVMFGSTPASSFSFVSDTQITAVVPPGNGNVSIKVITPIASSL